MTDNFFYKMYPSKQNYYFLIQRDFILSTIASKASGHLPAWSSSDSECRNA